MYKYFIEQNRIAATGKTKTTTNNIITINEKLKNMHRAQFARQSHKI